MNIEVTFSSFHYPLHYPYVVPKYYSFRIIFHCLGSKAQGMGAKEAARLSGNIQG